MIVRNRISYLLILLTVTALFAARNLTFSQDATPQEQVQPVRVQTLQPAPTENQQSGSPSVTIAPATPPGTQPGTQEAADPNAPPAEGEQKTPEEEKPREKIYYAPQDRPTGQPNLEADIQKDTMKIAFRGVPWREVLEWFADQAGMSLELEMAPPGTCNYYDDKTYTIEEALDILNGLMLRRGFTLVRSERLLLLVNLQDGIPVTLVPFITKEELDEKGKYELVRVLFNLTRTTPDVIEAEIQGLVGTQGNILSFPKSQQIVVTETVGQLRAIREIIQRIDDPDGIATGTPHLVSMQSVPADTALIMMKQLLGIGDNDSNLRTMVDASGMKIWMVGRADLVQQAKQMLEMIDKQYGDSSSDATLRFAVYPVTSADPNSVLSVMQTLLAGTPDVRLSLDSNTKALLVYARAPEHETVIETLRQMESISYSVEVIQLSKLSATAAKEAIEKFFVEPTSSTTETSRSFGPMASQVMTSSRSGIPAPVVTADPLLKQLLVRGTTTQIDQIKSLLEKMGETFGTPGRGTNMSTIRTIPLSPSAASLIVEQLEKVWPQISPHEIRVVTSSNLIKSADPNTRIPERSIDSKQNQTSPVDEALDKLFGPLPEPTPKHPQDRLLNRERFPEIPLPPMPPSENMPEQQPDPDSLPPPGTYQNPYQTQNLPNEVFYRRAVFVRETDEDMPTELEMPEEVVVETDVPVHNHPPAPPAPISVSVGPNGLMIASSDPDVLNQFEEIVRLLSDESFLKSSQLTVYYIKNAAADVVADSLRSLMGISSYSSSSSTSSSTSSPYGNTISDPVAAILGMASLGGSKIEATGPISITIESRLNALLIQANVVDHKTIEKLLPILDQLKSPEEVLATARPQLIPLKNIRAETAQQAVQAIFAQNLQSNSNRQGQQGNQPQMMGPMGGGGPPQFLQAMMQQMAGGGRQQQGSRSGRNQDNQETMTLAIDAQTNTLIVSAPEALFQEVRAFVEELDTNALGRDEVTQVVVTNGRLAPAQIQSALKAIAGDSVTVNNSVTSSSTSSTNRQGQQGSASPFGRGGFGGMVGFPFGGGMMGGGMRPGGMGGGMMGGGR